MISHYYSGRIFAMYHKGTEFSRKHQHEISKRIQLHFDTQVACMACGAKHEFAVRTRGPEGVFQPGRLGQGSADAWPIR